MNEEDAALITKGPAKTIDRVALNKEGADKVSGWLKQLEEMSSGYLQLSRSDVVNFLISEHKSEFSPREMQRIRSRHYDPIRHLNWITPRLKNALEGGDMEAVTKFQTEIRSIELSIIAQAKKISDAGQPSEIPARPRRQRVKKSKAVDLVSAPTLAELQMDLPEG